MLVRDERSSDINAIDSLTTTAFAAMEFSDGTEAPIVQALRADGDLTISLVAEIDGLIVGHVAISPLAIAGAGHPWFGLGPISVDPAHQRQGIGRVLISEALDRLRNMEATGCALIGNPEVYRGSGFASDGQLTYLDVPTEYVQRIVFHGDSPTGELIYAPAFDLEHP